MTLILVLFCLFGCFMFGAWHCSKLAVIVLFAPMFQDNIQRDLFSMVLWFIHSSQLNICIRQRKSICFYQKFIIFTSVLLEINDAEHEHDVSENWWLKWLKLLARCQYLESNENDHWTLRTKCVRVCADNKKNSFQSHQLS